MSKSAASGPSQRMLRVGEQVRHALSEVLQRGEIIDPLIETTVISISEVRMSPDLKIATAFVSPLGAKDPDAVVEALNKHAKFVRGRISHALRQMRSMPEVAFQARHQLRQFRQDQRTAEIARSGARSRRR